MAEIVFAQAECDIVSLKKSFHSGKWNFHGSNGNYSHGWRGFT